MSTPMTLGQRLAWLEETLIGYLLATMVVVQFINVILRYMGTGWFWALEFTLFCFLFMILFGMSVVMRHGMHIGIDVIVNLFPKTTQRVINTIVGAICLAYAAIFAASGYGMFHKFFLSNPVLRRLGSDDLDFPNWATYGFFSLAFIYLAITVIFETVNIARGHRDSLTSGHEAEEAVEQAVAQKQALEAGRGEK